VALAFAREGADVLISYLPEEEPDAQETARVVEVAGKKVVKMPGNIGDEAHCQRLLEQAISKFGKIDILVNNAAYQMYRGEIESITAQELEHTYRTNVFLMFYLCKAALEHMQPGSSIINTCSVEVYQPQPMLLDYASTKAAIVNFTKGLAMEVAQQGIRVNSVAPGPVWTPLIPATMPAEQSPSLVSRSRQWDAPPSRRSSPLPTSSRPPRSPATSTPRPKRNRRGSSALDLTRTGALELMEMQRGQHSRERQRARQGVWIR
jgi:NAD(P)-dependent dehydrogenase (short-subunit alcohol dehydrogenase family)